MLKHLFSLSLCLVLLLSSCKPKNQQDTLQISSEKELQEHLLFGWNTWHNPHLLTYVLMPEGLAVKLNFRTTFRGQHPYFLDQAYISSPFHKFPEQIIPVAHTYNGRYTELILTFQGLKARIQTASYKDDIFILYTPLEVPEHPPLLILEAGMLYNLKGNVQTKKNLIQADMGPVTYNIAGTKPDSMLPLGLANPYMTYSSENEIGFYTGRVRTQDFIRRFVNNRKEQVLKAKEVYGDLADAYDAQQSLLAWNIIYDPFKHRAITPVSRVWNEDWGGWVLFDWDTYFTAAMFALDNKYHAFANAIAISDEVTESGFVPNFSATLLNEKSYDRSQPPVGSIICKLIYDKYPEKWFLEEVFPNLLSWNRWWPKERDNQGYLSWGSDPHPKGHLSNTKQAAQFESGLDNSPHFDDAVFNEEKNLLELASVDLLSLYIADCNHLALIAEILGKTEEKTELIERSRKYSAKLAELWDEKTGIYRDKDLITNTFSKRLSPTNFYPLLSGVPTQEQAERMINEHFMNPNEFYGEFMLASISKNDPAYKDNSYWRGRIWAPMNFLVYLGLRNYDLPEARKVLAEKSLNLIMKEWRENKRVFENYNAETGVGSDVPNSDGFYSWGGLLSLIALMENGYWEQIPEGQNQQ